ncbi:MAG: YsnF/AvaK domain-containing protein [Persicimonas sp.]
MDAKAKVIDEAGQVGRLMTPVSRSGHNGTVTIALDEHRQVVVPTERLSQDGDGTARFDGRFDEFDITADDGSARQTPPQDTQAQQQHGPDDADGEQVRVPVARERMSVSRERRPVGRVRIHKRVEEEEVPIEEHLDFDEADIERVRIERVVDGAPAIRHEGDTIVVPLVEERLVKQLVVVEEVRITRRRRSEEIDESVTLRREKVDIERDRLDSKSEPRTHRPS